MRMTAMCLALLLFTCPEPKPQRRIIVFQDITMSMANDEAATVQKIVDQIVEGAPGGSQLVVIPICENTAGAPELHRIVPFEKGTTPAAAAENRKERAAIKTDIAKFVQDIREHTNAARSDYSSCISPGLRLAKNAMRTPNATRKWNTDIVFVSDMIEECRTSLLGQPVRLKVPNRQFSEAAKLVAGDRPLQLFPPARVFVILPKAASTAAANPDYPSSADLQTFWQQLFARSGIPSNRLWWDADISHYLDSIRG